ncbi:MAG: type II toxin-antitoxin system VapC family toxin [Nitrososphaerales archaeon]
MRFLDSNVFIYHLLNDPRNGKHARKILESVEDGQEAAVPLMAITQICSYLKWRKLPETIPIFLKLLQSLPTLNKEETLFSDYISALSLQEKLRLPWTMWDDLVIASQMQRLGIHEIYSFDTDFDKISVVKRLH